MSQASSPMPRWIAPWLLEQRSTGGRLWIFATLSVIFLVALWVRYNGLGAVGLYWDEKYMFPAALGVLETGLPILDSGMLYPRAMLQSYLMAGSVFVFGESEWAFRFPSALIGALCVPLAYCLGRNYLHPTMSLAFAGTVAIFPAFIEISQMARMYGFLVFCVLLFLIAHARWERTGSWPSVLGMIAAVIVGLEFQPLAIFVLPLVLVPVLTAPSWRRAIQAVVVIAVAYVAYLLVEDFVALQYAGTLDEEIDTAINLAPVEVAGVLSLSQGSLIMAVLLGAGMTWVFVWASKARFASAEGIDRWFLVVGGVGLIASLLSAIAVSYALAWLAACVGTALYVRGGGRIRTVLIVVGSISLLVILQGIDLIRNEGWPGIRGLAAFYLSFPSPTSQIRFIEFFPLAAFFFGVLFLADLYRFAKGEVLRSYLLFVMAGVAVPVLIMGAMKWSIAPRFMLGLVPIFMLCYFIAVEGELGRWWQRAAAYAVPSALAGLLAVVTLIRPGDFLGALDRTYGNYPDHKGAADFIRTSTIGDDAIIIAIDAPIQNYYLDRIDYYLRHTASVAWQARQVDGELVDIFTGTRVIPEASAFRAVLGTPARGDIYVIGSGAISTPVAYRHALGDAILGLFDEFGAEVVFTGRDGVTLVWRFPAMVSNAARYDGGDHD